MVGPFPCPFASSPEPPLSAILMNLWKSNPYLQKHFDLPRSYIAIQGRVNWNPVCLKYFPSVIFWIHKMFRLEWKTIQCEFCSYRIVARIFREVGFFFFIENVHLWGTQRGMKRDGNGREITSLNHFPVCTFVHVHWSKRLWYIMRRNTKVNAVRVKGKVIIRLESKQSCYWEKSILRVSI